MKTNPTATSKTAGLSPGAIYNLQRGAAGKLPLKGGNSRTYDAIAPVLRTTVAWLTKGEGPEEIDQSALPRARKPSRLIDVPLLSWASAGKLADANSQIPVEDAHRLPFADLGRGDFFALRVADDSMDRVSPNGSNIAVNRAERELINGKPYVFFSLQEGTTYKLWHSDPPYLLPFSTNPTHQPIFIKRKRDFFVIGRVRRTVLDL